MEEILAVVIEQVENGNAEVIATMIGLPALALGIGVVRKTGVIRKLKEAKADPEKKVEEGEEVDGTKA
jgi:hypothetical protein